MSTRLRVTPFIFDCFILNNRIICPVAEEVVREVEVLEILAVEAAPKGIFKLQVQKDVVTTRMRLACTCWQGNGIIREHQTDLKYDLELVRDRMEEVPRCLGSEPVQLDVT